MFHPLFNLCLCACSLALAVRAYPSSTTTAPTSITKSETTTTTTIPTFNSDTSTAYDLLDSSETTKISSQSENNVASSNQDFYTPGTETVGYPQARTVTKGLSSVPVAVYDTTTVRASSDSESVDVVQSVDLSRESSSTGSTVTSRESESSVSSTVSTTDTDSTSSISTKETAESSAASLQHATSAPGSRQKVNQEDDQERLMKDVRRDRKTPEPFFAPRDIFDSGVASNVIDEDTEKLIDEVGNKMRREKDTAPFYAPTDIFHLKKQVVTERPHHVPTAKNHEPFYAPFDIFHAKKPASVDKVRNDTPERTVSEGKDETDDLIAIINKHRGATLNHHVPTAKDHEPFYAPYDIFHAKKPEPMDTVRTEISERTYSEENDETDDLIAIINKHRGANLNTDQTGEDEEEDLLDVLEKHRQDKFQLSEENEDSVSTTNEKEDQLTSNDMQKKASQEKMDSKSSSTSDVQTEPRSSEHSGLFADADITAIVAVAASAAGLLIVLLIVVISVWYFRCSAKAQARRKQKDVVTPNIQMNRWDPQMLRPCKDSMDAFMFGPPIASVDELFTKY